MQTMYREAPVCAGTAAKCGACLAFAALVAAIGAGADGPDADPRHVAAIARGAPHAVNAVRVEAHRKAVFDERRARFDGTWSRRLAAAATHDGSFLYSAP
jgi:hypothetical protein